MKSQVPTIGGVDSPLILRKLEVSQLQQVADDIREFILQSVAKTGGHLASSLGAVELAVALHYAFATPEDRLVWDVGHQSYAHKILTGRKPAFSQLRKMGGMSGFPSMAESSFDAFGGGHAGTAISAALGMAMGLRCTRSEARVVAIVGDAALSAGMAFEALNHAGTFGELPLTIVLNDNGMSISPAVGALNEHLRQLCKHQQGAAEGKADSIEDADNQTAGKYELPTLFGLLGLAYVGPIDGHDLTLLTSTFNRARVSRAPQVIHVVTQKGRGYGPAEADPVTYHGPGPFSLEFGVRAVAGGRLTFSQVFSHWICEAAERDTRIVGITPAMREGSSLVEFERKFPDRYVDVGIAEQHALTLAAGLATAGMRPVVAIYSTFLQRGYDQLIHDIALQNLPVLFAIDRAGIAGGDGATHLGAFDLAALRCVPNMVLMTPSDEEECYRMLATGLQHAGPSAVRYPRATGHADVLTRSTAALPLGKGVIQRSSGLSWRETRVALLAFGPVLPVAMEVGQRIDATVANMRFVKPLDEDLLLEIAEEHDVLVTLEEATIIGGAGSACAERVAAEGIPVRVLRLGLPDAFIEHGDRSALLAMHGLDVKGVLKSIRRFIQGGDDAGLQGVKRL